MQKEGVENNQKINRERGCHHRDGLFWTLILCWYLAIPPVCAQSNTEKAMVSSQSNNELSESPVWGASSVFPKNFDWIQLTSGEWLKGDLKVFYTDSLDFESEELDLLTFDWMDIQQIRSCSTKHAHRKNFA